MSAALQTTVVERCIRRFQIRASFHNSGLQEIANSVDYDQIIP